MKKILLIVFAFTLIITPGVYYFNCSRELSGNYEGILQSTIALNPDSMVKRGKYLVTIMGCNDCHSPIVMSPQGPAYDTSRLLSGHPQYYQLPPANDINGYVLFSSTGTAMTGPWGTSFAANITSDETGIGNWTEEQFFKAIREGKFKGLDNTRTMMPPMPWPSYSKASDEDLRSIFAYLKSTTPVYNVVPSYIPPAHEAIID